VYDTFSVAGNIELEVVLTGVGQDFDLQVTIAIIEIPVNWLLVDTCSCST